MEHHYCLVSGFEHLEITPDFFGWEKAYLKADCLRWWCYFHKCYQTADALAILQKGYGRLYSSLDQFSFCLISDFSGLCPVAFSSFWILNRGRLCQHWNSRLFWSMAYITSWSITAYFKYLSFSCSLPNWRISALSLVCSSGWSSRLSLGECSQSKSYW